MLILSRVVGELISIGDDISVRLVGVNGGTVRFGVEAPQNVEVHRSEVYERIQLKLPRKKKQARGRYRSSKCFVTSCLSVNWHCSLSGSKTISA